MQLHGVLSWAICSGMMRNPSWKNLGGLHFPGQVWTCWCWANTTFQVRVRSCWVCINCFTHGEKYYKSPLLTWAAGSCDARAAWKKLFQPCPQLVFRTTEICIYLTVCILKFKAENAYQTCSWVSLWQVFDDFIFIFFAMEMVLKMVALGIFGKKCYLGDTWNRLDFFIVMAG